ncbi:MAG: hypothetical protein RMJ98_11350 [Myxococcales bacterium]|nr:hypothetical protein [Polyangiaceae bacterium]MDW8249883.1 hypothetical protein [Myxococcales bacterium]
MRSWLLASSLALAAACSSPPPPAAPSPPEPPPSSAPASPPPDASASAPAPPLGPPPPAFPTECAGTQENICQFGDGVVERICKVQSTDVALTLLRGGTPWTRGYLRGNTEAWNAAEGGTARYKMLLDEEVLVLRKRAASTMMVGQGASFDVLRWDGSCVSLSEGELTLKKPPKPRASPISWKELSGPTRDALSADAKVAAAYERRRKECKGVTSGDVSAACVKADGALSDAILEFLRSGGQIPTPTLP